MHALASHCSSELNFTRTLTNTTKNACRSYAKAGNNRLGERRRSCSDVEGVLAGLSVFVYSNPFPFVLCLRLSPPFSSASSSLSLSTGFSFGFLFFPSPLFYFPHLTVMQGWRKENPSVLNVFPLLSLSILSFIFSALFSPIDCLSFIFFLIFPPFPFFLPVEEVYIA